MRRLLLLAALCLGCIPIDAKPAPPQEFAVFTCDGDRDLENLLAAKYAQGWHVIAADRLDNDLWKVVMWR